MQKRQSNTFHDIFHEILRYLKFWKIAFLLICLGVASSTIFLTYGKRGYYSRSLVSFTDLYDPIRSETSEVTGSGRWAQLRLVLWTSLKSRWLVEQTANKLRLVSRPSQFEYIRDNFVSKVLVTPMPGNIFQIEVYGYQPWVVREWPEAMIESYQEYVVSQKEKHRESAVQAYTDEMKKLREKIYSDRNDLVKFEEDNKIIEQYISNNSLEQVPSELLSLKARISSMDEIVVLLDESKLSIIEKLSLIKKFRGKPVPVGSIIRNSVTDNMVTAVTPGQVPVSNVGIKDATGTLASGMASPQIVVVPSMVEELEPWERTERELRAARQEHEHLAQTFLPGHELMRNVGSKIAQLELALEDEFRIAKSSFLLEREHLAGKFVDLQKKMPDYRRVFNDFDKFKQDYNLLTSGRVVWENAYAKLKQKVTAMDYTGSELISDLTFQGFTMLRDDVPVSPNKKSLLIYGFVIGLILAGVVSYSFEKFKSSTSLVSETEQLTGLHALGVLPLSSSNDDFRKLFASGQTAVTTGYDSRESFRIVRSSLPLHVSKENKCQVILVTSARPGEGKTVASSLLARSYADAGEKVILIDADLRRGRIEQLLDIASSNGLSAYLQGALVSFDDCVTHMPGGNLDVVVRGGYSSSAVEELGRPRFLELIKKLRESYTKIIIDTPPTLGLADALTIVPAVDGVLFVIRAEKTTQRDIASGIEHLSISGVPIFGFLLNGVDLSKVENYYYYSSYYPKYYDTAYDYSPNLN